MGRAPRASGTVRFCFCFGRMTRAPFLPGTKPSHCLWQSFKQKYLPCLVHPSRTPANQRDIHGFEVPVDVRTAARFLGVIPSLMYACVERKQIPLSE